MDARKIDRTEDNDDPLFQVTAVWHSLKSAAALAGLTEDDESSQESGGETEAA